MSETNGGSLSTGERLTRIENRLESIETHLEQRITRHKEANEATIKELATSIVTDFGKRITTLETKDVAEEARQAALAAAKEEARSNKRWVIGSAVSLGGLMLGIIVLLLQLQGKV